MSNEIIFKTTIFCLFFFSACQIEEFDLQRTKELSIFSTTTNATYLIKVALPEPYNAAQKYKTIYVLDGTTDFDFVANTSEQLARETGKTGVIVVGIGYGNSRNDDYTPTQTQDGGGKAKEFMTFIETELIPKIEQEFAVDTSRLGKTIVGHSYGGLLATYAFINFNDIFGNYILLSPSLWYDDGVLLHYEQEHRNANVKSETNLFLALGQLEENMHPPIEALHLRLRQYYPNAKTQKRIAKNLNHEGSKRPNMESGLRFYFSNN